MTSFLAFLWLLRTTKAVLFWLYLWQLKEYHLGRFIDHFRTDKGKRLFGNWLFLLKAVFIPTFFFLPLLVFFAILIGYILEALKVVWDLLRGRIVRPVLTKKTLLLIITGILAEILFFGLLSNFALNIMTIAFGLLVFDVFVSLIVSGIVFLFQPLTVFLRNQIIQKAKIKRAQFKDLIVIGITGSYGKTSTKEFLAAILAERFKVLKTKEHQNSEIGIAHCILNELTPEHEIFVVEMGAYNVGGIKFLADIVKPKIGLLTGINEQHMATFGSQENIIKAKYELIESLPEDGVAFFNGKNKYCQELFEKTTIEKRLYGKETELPGTENILGAMAVARELGMTEEEIAKVAEKIKNKTGGFSLKKGIDGLKIIDATYSANPDGVMVHLDYLKSFPGKKIIIMPCLIELGKAAIEVHKRIGEKIGQVCDLAIITTKDRVEEIKEGAALVEVNPQQERGLTSTKQATEIAFLENPKEILKKIKSFAKEGDIILLESRVPKIILDSLTKSD